MGSSCLREVVSAMINSFCRDEVSGPLTRCGVFKSDGGRLVNDGPQSFAETRYHIAHMYSYLSDIFSNLALVLLGSREIYGHKQRCFLSVGCVYPC